MWPDDTPFPALVFVPAYEQYAVPAFEAQAIDYVLKPVEPVRLRKTLARIQDLLSTRQDAAPRDHADPSGLDAPALMQALDRMRALLAPQPGLTTVPAGATPPAPMAPMAPLRHIQAGVGTSIRLIPVEDVLYFEAADKYVRVITSGHEDLIRTPLRELVPRLDPDRFWQVHRGTVVQVAAIEQVLRDASGRLTLALRGSKDRLVVSRVYAHLFKAM